ncbi:MAG: hypothetical protein E7042_03070 [Lentisphaerae bacterium]|nr:hypothetical protein [Lentisphaerota bacterium]
MKKYLKISQKNVISLIVAAVVILLLSTLRVERAWYFEYPSFLSCRELRIWGIPVHVEKTATPLSDFIVRQKITIPAEKNLTFTVSRKIISIKGVERCCGGIGGDLSKLCYVVEKKLFGDAEIMDVLNLLFQQKFVEFRQKVGKLYYRIGL